MQASNRKWWIVGFVLIAAVLYLLASIVGRQGTDEQSQDLAPGESEMLRARVLEVVEEGTIQQEEFEQPYQVLRLRITEGPLQDREIEIEYGVLTPTSNNRLFRAGDHVQVDHTETVDGEDLFFIADFVRTGPLLWLTLLFVAAIVVLSGWQGVRSLVGMGIGLVVILAFIVPQILAGREPVVVAILGSMVMMGLSLYIVYGWRPKTHVAVASLFLTLILTGLLAVWSVNWARLSGFGAEEASFLRFAGIQLDPRGLLLAGMIIGALGALDDIAVGQSSSIFELSKADPQMGWQALFRSGMVIGRDHVAAMVNTLFLAYVGAALPLLLMFSVFVEPVGVTVNREIIAEEIVRTLVGSLGLLAGVPLTSLIAALVAQKRSKPQALHEPGAQ